MVVQETPGQPPSMYVNMASPMECLGKVPKPREHVVPGQHVQAWLYSLGMLSTSTRDGETRGRCA